MSQSFYQIYLHIVFSTKNRQPLLDDGIRPRVHAYLATVARDHGCPFVHVGGVEDHVHLLVELGKDVLPVALIGKIKQESSKFVKTLGSRYSEFYWQNGYGAFSIGVPQKDVVVQYIDGQIEHHRKRSFKEELRGFLKKYGFDYNEQYMWD
jgi:REP element-mobilizing transposase RayT